MLHVFQPVAGGVPAYVHDLALALHQRGWQTTVACDPTSNVVAGLRAGGVAVEPFVAHRAPAPGDLGAARRLGSLVRRTRPSLIHAHSSKAGLLAGPIGRALRVPTIYTPHGWSFQMDEPAALRAAFAGTEAVLARTAHRALIAVCASERSAALAWRVAPPDKISVVRTGRRATSGAAPDRAAIRARLGVPGDRSIAAWIGRAGAQKGSAGLPGLAALLAADGIVLAPLGGGLVEDGTADAVLAAGGVVVDPSIGAPELLAAADVLISTSAWEGLPLVVIEALEHALPIVAFDVGGLPEQVVEGVNGHLVAVGDGAALAARTAQIVADRALARRYGLAGRELWSRRFRPETMVDRIELIYRDVLARRG